VNNGGNLYNFSNDLQRPTTNAQYEQVQQQLVKNEKRRRGGRILGFIIFLLLLIITFLVLYIIDLKKIYNVPYMDKVDDFISSKLVKAPEETVNDEKKNNNETELTEQKTKDELMNKVLYMSTLDSSPKSKTTLFKGDLNVSDLTDIQKLRIATYGLNAIEDKYVEVTDKEELKNIYPDLPEEELVGFKAIAATAVNNRYLGVFGVKPTPQSITEGCPTFNYSEKTNKYYLNSKCVDIPSDEIVHLYAYDFTKDDKYNYVYVAVAVSKTDGDEVTIYSDYALEKAYTVISKEELKDFKIDKDSYEHYSKYKIYFVKNESANYVFEKIELIKEDE
jgi:hypothetical protein